MSGDNDRWNELELLRALLTAVHDRESRRDPPKGSIAAVLDQLLARFRKLQDRALEAALPSNQHRKGSFGERRSYLYLEPVEKGTSALPILDFRWDFERSSPRIALRLMLFLLDGGSLRGIGFRLESAEEAGKAHCYPHAQLLSRLESPRDHEPATQVGSQQGQDGIYISWLPETQPAFPLPTSTSVGLLLCLLLSLYGPTFVKDIQRDLARDQRMVALLRRECLQIIPNLQLA